MLAGATLRGCFKQSIEILAFETDNADAVDIAEFALDT